MGEAVAACGTLAVAVASAMSGSDGDVGEDT